MQRNRVWNPGPETGEEHEKEEPAPELNKSLPPHTLKWLTKENEKWHRQLKTDIAMLIHSEDKQADLVEVFCGPTSPLAKNAENANLKVERWTLQDFDLSKPSGCKSAEERLKEVKPKRLWLSPESGPDSVGQNTMNRKEEMRIKRERAFREWQSCIRRAWLQVELG